MQSESETARSKNSLRSRVKDVGLEVELAEITIPSVPAGWGSGAQNSNKVKVALRGAGERGTGHQGRLL